ncbi:MAG: hypothetical protein GY953_47050, partial [bacterium]|nr:hypothetical protein [bacterium]
TLIRVTSSPAAAEIWIAAIPEHNLIVDAIRSGDPLYAEQTTLYVIRSFLRGARDVWTGNQRTKVETSRSTLPPL